MAYQLGNRLHCIRHCMWCIVNKIVIVNSVRVDDRTTELAIIASNDL